MRRTRFASGWRDAALSGTAALAAMIGIGLAPALALAQVAPAFGPVPATPPAAQGGSAAANGVGSAFELTFWQSLTGSEDTASYEAYLVKYPDGTFSGLARAKIAAIQRAMTVQPATAPTAPVAATVPAVVPAITSVPALVRTPAVVTASTLASEPASGPGAAPVLSAASPVQPAEMVSASASVPAPLQSSPLANLLAQLRGAADGTTPAAAAAPLVTAAPAVQTAAAMSALAQTVVAAAPAAQPQTYVPSAGLAQAPAAAPNYAAARPVMLPVPDVPLPPFFCSNDARNAFHNSAYRPAVEVATRNNEAAVSYLRQLQQTYDRGQLGRDTAVLNAIASEARAYQAEAARAYSAQALLVRQFDTLMTVPLRTCLAGNQ